MEFKNLDESRLGPFLTTVTLRLCADRHRERANDERLRRRLGPERDAPGPEDDVCDRSEAVWLATRFGELTARQQEIVRAREAGLSCAEVASRFRMSYVSVESSLARARSRFREALAKTMGVLSPSAWRWSSAVVDAATVTAITVGGLGGPVVVAATKPPVPPVVSLPSAEAPRPEPRTPSRPAVAVARPAAVSQPVSVAPREALAGTPRVRTDHEPPDEPPVTGLGGWEVKPNPRNDEFTTEERLEHCVRYGVKTTGGIRCRYPDET